MVPSTTHPHAPTRARHLARPSATSRPVVSALASHSTAAWADALRARTAVRAKVTATVVALLTMVALLLLVPRTVMIPLAAVLVAGLSVGGLMQLARVRMRTTPGAPERRHPVSRRDA